MTPERDHDQAGTSDNVIDMGQQPPNQQRPLPWRIIAAVVILMIGGVAGYAIGYHHGTASASSRPTPGPTPAAEPFAAVSLTGRQCAVQLGRRLVLGVELRNDTTHTVFLKAIDIRIPFDGGLSVRTKQFGACGVVGGNTGPQPLAAGNSTWMNASFDTHLPCRGQVEVDFTVEYDGGTATGGFSHLPDIAYAGCSASPG